MANKRLSAVEIQQMKTMVTKGTAPEDIATHFGMSISSVHNYKKRFKQEGLKFPDVRGMRPVGAVQSVNAAVSNKTPGITSQGKDRQPSGAINLAGSPTQDFTITVNGVSVHIPSNAKDVIIGKDKMEIKF